MTRDCADCGIAPGQGCVCSDEYAEWEAERDARVDRLDDYAPATFTPASVNGARNLPPKDGDPGAAPQGPVLAPAADPSCAEPDGSDPARATRSRAGSGRLTLAGEGRTVSGESRAPSPVEHRHDEAA